MSVSRRNFLSSAAAVSMLAGLIGPEKLHALQQAQEADSNEAELPHSSPGFWNGFYDVANPSSATGQSGATRGSDSLVDAKLETQYLHYKDKKLRYATSIEKTELLDHDGDVSVSILMNQFRPGSQDGKERNASQLRVDTAQNYPLMNLVAPLAWTALASLHPDKAGKIPSLDQLGFRSDQVMNSSSHILLTQGSGKIAVNISRAPHNSAFVKVLGVIIEAAKMAAPFVALPAVSVPAMSAFSEAFSYWEDRTQFLINGNLVNACATQQAMGDEQLRSPIIGLLAGDYVVVAKKDADELKAQLQRLHIFQGYLVHEDTDLNQPIDKVIEDKNIPDITYATVKVAVNAVDTSYSKPGKAAEPSGGGGGDCPAPSGKKKSGK